MITSTLQHDSSRNRLLTRSSSLGLVHVESQIRRHDVEERMEAAQTHPVVLLECRLDAEVFHKIFPSLALADLFLQTVWIVLESLDENGCGWDQEPKQVLQPFTSLPPSSCAPIQCRHVLRVYEAIPQSPVGLPTTRPYDGSLKKELKFTITSKLPADIYRCSQASIDEVRFPARHNDVVWRTEEFSSDGEQVTLTVVSVSRRAVERVYEALERAISCEPFSTLAFLDGLQLPFQWQTFGELARAAASESASGCIVVKWCGFQMKPV